MPTIFAYPQKLRFRFFSSTCSNQFSLWHNRLGHMNSVCLKSILKLYNLALPNKESTGHCSSCSIGKSHRLHAPLSNTVYSAAFDLVHVDLWGPSPNLSSLGYSYDMAIVDSYCNTVY